MAIDYSALLYDPVYAELGVAAVFSAGTAGEATITVIDEIKRKSSISGTTEVRGVDATVCARIPELANLGIERDDYIGAVLTFNGRSWVVRNFDLLGNPNGEDLGHVRFLLKAAAVESTDG